MFRSIDVVAPGDLRVQGLVIHHQCHVEGTPCLWGLLIRGVRIVSTSSVCC